MNVRTAGALLACLAAGPVGVAAAPAQADASATPSCTATVPASAFPAPAPGEPCWTDLDGMNGNAPYPFGFDGNPVDTSSPACQAQDRGGDPVACYLSVDSMAFRAWNRGIAVTSPAPNSGLSTTPFGVWLYNGIRWFPDPTFPGQSVCKGSTAVWAGKLDYWVIGQIPGANWPALCRFDGVNFEWEPLPVPKSALVHVPINSLTGQPASGAIQTGACFAWNDCWFFGSFGVVLRWDGQSLTDATPDTANSPWLASNFTAAIARTDAGGDPFAFAVGLPAAATTPDGTPSAEVWRSSGRAFTPVDGSSFQSPPVAVDFNSQAQGWAAGDGGGQPPGPTSSLPTTGASPLTCLSASGTALANDSFTNSPSLGYLWSSISVLPNGDALAGGQDGGPSAGLAPVVAEISCDQNQPSTLSFGSGSLELDDPGGWISAVAANAVNDEWAAATTAQINQNPPSPPPHLYHLTDTQTPLAPAGDDIESRPLVTQTEPTIFQFAPPVVIPPPPPAPAPASTPGKTTIKRVKARPPIYAIQPPKLARISTGRFSLSISFKVRSKVTIGLEALRRGKVVSSSGFKTFRGRTGELVLQLDANQWPTSLKFIFPKNRGHK